MLKLLKTFEIYYLEQFHNNGLTAILVSVSSIYEWDSDINPKAVKYFVKKKY